jgi:hypothetical protein
MSIPDGCIASTYCETPAGNPGPPMSTPCGHGRNDQHIVPDHSEDLMRDTAEEHALEQRESAGSDHHQIGANAARDLLDRSER